MKFFVLLVGFLFLSGVYSAPAPWGIALNNLTNECMGFWAGDEFSHFSLPEGWTAVYSFSEEWGALARPEECGELQTEVGIQNCCEKNGFVYVSKSAGEEGILGVLILVLAVLGFIFWLIWRGKFKKRK